MVLSLSSEGTRCGGPIASKHRRFRDAESERAGGEQDTMESCESLGSERFKPFTFVVRIGVQVKQLVVYK